MNLAVENWTIEELTGYVPKTTFYTDFSIADKFGTSAIQDTYNRAFAEWKNNVEYLTELVIVLNWKIWRWHTHNDQYARLYNDLWQKTDKYCMDHLKGSDLQYYVRTTD